jgi:hypothetical protein
MNNAADRSKEQSVLILILSRSGVPSFIAVPQIWSSGQHKKTERVWRVVGIARARLDSVKICQVLLS